VVFMGMICVQWVDRNTVDSSRKKRFEHRSN
jgi:hypothetical protein